MIDSEKQSTSGYVVDINSESDFTAVRADNGFSNITHAMCQSRAMHVCSQP